MVTTLRERRRQLLREEILQAAQSLMAAKGHQAMSMDELAARVGISKPTLYSFFSTKEEIIIQAAISSMEALITLIEAEQGHKTPLESLALLLHSIIQLQIDDETMALRPWTAELFHLLHTNQEALAYLERIDAAIICLIQAGIAQGEIDSTLDPATVIRAFYGLIHTPKIAPHSKGGEPNPKAIATTLTTIFVRGVRGNSASKED